MFSLYLTLFNIIAAATFIVMWLDDRRHLYLLHWGIANLIAPVVLYLTTVLATATVSSYNFSTGLYALSASYACVGMVIGAYYFRGRSFNYAWLIILYAVCPLLWWVLVSTTRFEQSRIFFNLMLVVSYLWVARLLWSKVLIERVVAIFFVVRAMAVLLAFWLRLNMEEVLNAGLISGVAAAASALNVLLLLLIAFRKVTTDLKRNIQFLNIIHLITAVIHSAKTERELGEKVLKVLLDQPYWNLGLLLKITPDKEYLELIYGKGNNNDILEALAAKKVPLMGTLTESVIKTGTATVISDAAVNTERLNPIARVFHKNIVADCIHVITPVIHRSDPVGVLVLTDHNARALYPQELKTLTSIGEVIGFAFENIRQFDTLNYRASHDVLTGLGNRAKLHDHCQQVLASTPFTLMLFDLDNFKEVNDVFGHAVGDKLLQDLALRLSETLAGKASLFRLGGDEFVVIYPNTSEYSAEKSAAILLELIKRPASVGELRLQNTASIGVVETTLAGNDSHELLRCADLAMYKAKRSELNIAYYDKAYDTAVRERIELLADIKSALHNRELELFYQPIIDLNDNSCPSCEGLLRWHHPTRGLLNAAEFIPVIETTEEIATVTHRVIELALQDIAKWREQGAAISVAINLSARNFLDPLLPDFLVDTAKAYGVPTYLLQLEITETVLMKDPQLAEQITGRLHNAGFKIVLDDFGTGYSSLAYLGRFPISVVKMDRSFVGAMSHDKRSKNIVEATISLTHKLGFMTTAEGVENTETVALLEDLGCDFVQGFLYSKPVNRIAFDAWYQQNLANRI